MHVGVVSFGYPPIPHVSGARAEGMALQLAELGHSVTVLTVDWRSSGGDRPARTFENGVDVVRVDPRVWYPSFDPRTPPFETELPPRSPLMRRLRTLRSTVAWGSNARWAAEALEALLRVHAARPLDVTWAIHGDDSSHEIAMRLHRETGVPWIADFKDAWNVFHSRALWPLQWLATRRRLRTATAMTETSDAQASLDGHFGRPLNVVWSGYDDVLMAKAPPVAVSDAFVLGYFGTIAIQHDVPRLARALATAREVPFELHVFGGRDGERWRSALGGVGLASRLHLHPMLTREETFARMKGVDVLLLMPAGNFGRSRFAIGVKELEYFASGTPVLSIGKLLPELRRVTGSASQVWEAETEVAAAAFLREEYRARSGARSSRRAEVNAVAIARHSWTGQARLLAEILEEAARPAAMNVATGRHRKAC